MAGQNTKRFALVGMLAGAMLFTVTPAAAQGQAGTAGSTSAAPQGTQPGTGTSSLPDSTTRSQQQLPMPPDTLSPDTGTGGSGSLPSQNDALDSSGTRGDDTLRSPDTREPNTRSSGGTVTPDTTNRNTTIDPGTGGSGLGNTGSDVGTSNPGTGSGTNTGTGSDINSGSKSSTGNRSSTSTNSSIGTGTDSPGQRQGQVSPDSMYKGGNTSSTTR